MIRKVARQARDWLRTSLRDFLDIHPNYIGDNGCIRAAASFVTWNQVEGDYLEFGVWRGYSFVTAYRELLAQRAQHLQGGFESPAYERWKANRPRFFAFDGFKGLPASTEASSMADYGEGAYACGEQQFVANIRRAGVSLKDVVIVPGMYDDTCNSDTKARHQLRKAAVVMIDCDLYESTVPVLNFLTDIVQQGTILVFDDWFRFKGNPNDGEQRACREWLERNPHLELIEFWRQGPQAVAFLVNFKHAKDVDARPNASPALEQPSA